MNGVVDWVGLGFSLKGNPGEKGVCLNGQSKKMGRNVLLQKVCCCYNGTEQQENEKDDEDD